MKEAALLTIIAVGFFGGLGFLIDYARSADWHNPLTRHIFGMSSAVLILFGGFGVRMAFDITADWTPFWLVLGTTFDVLILQRWAMMRRSRREDD